MKIFSSAITGKVGELVTLSLLMVAQSHVWHLLAKSGQKHSALNEFYTGLQEESDKLAEVFIGRGGELKPTPKTLVTSYSDDDVIQGLKDYRDLVTSCLSSEPEDSSLNDILIDIQELIDSITYKFNLD